MKRVFLTLAVLIFAFSAKADVKTGPSKCGYAPRSVMSEALSELDTAIVGLADCNDLLPGTTALVVGKFDKLDETKLREFVLKHVRVADGTSKTAEITWQSRQPLEKRQLIAKTISPPTASRDYSDVMSHYAFVAKGRGGAFLVFVHTARDADSKKLRTSLEKLNRNLSQSSFLALI